MTPTLLAGVWPLPAAGPVSGHISIVFAAVFWTSVVVFVVVASAIVYAGLRFRRRGDREPDQVHGHRALEFGWTAVPLLILIGLFAYSAANLRFITSTPPGAMHVCVEAQRFAWIFYYEPACGQPRLEAHDKRTYAPADKSVVRSVQSLYVPAGRPVALDIVSDDVNHSFYVPLLAGQMNAIPGQVNHMWLEATAPGRFPGQCTELCGEGHSRMLMDVVVVPADRYGACMRQLAAKQKPAPACSPGG